MRSRFVLIAVAALALSGCATMTATKMACQAYVVYDAKTKAAQGDAVAALPPDSPLIGVMHDYGALYNANLKACPRR